MWRLVEQGTTLRLKSTLLLACGEMRKIYDKREVSPRSIAGMCEPLSHLPAVADVCYFIEDMFSLCAPFFVVGNLAVTELFFMAELPCVYSKHQHRGIGQASERAHFDRYMRVFLGLVIC